MKGVFFPYQTINGDLHLSINDLEVDDARPSPNPMDPEDIERRQIDLSDQEKSAWQTLKIHLELQGPPEEIRTSSISGEMAATAVVSCASTQERRGVSMVRSTTDPSKWSAILRLDREDFRGPVTVTAVLSGPVNGAPHRFLGSTDSWTLHFDQPAISPKSGAITVKWVDFANDSNLPFLRQFANEHYYADLEGERPILYLNKGGDFERLPLILRDRRRRGPDRALHNAERVSIARGVWLGMLNTALASIKAGEDGADPEWPDSDWQQKLLKYLLPRIYRNQGNVEALKTAFEIWKSRRIGSLQSQAQVEVNRRMASSRLLRESLRSLDDRPEER